MRHEQGMTLIENLIGLAVLGLVAVTFLSGVALTARSVIISHERVTAESLAKSQLEYVKNGNYSASGNYSEIEISPELSNQGYTIDDLRIDPVGNVSLDKIQKVTVTIKRGNQTLLTLEDYKVNR